MKKFKKSKIKMESSDAAQNRCVLSSVADATLNQDKAMIG
jgi:hypothetical protein